MLLVYFLPAEVHVGSGLCWGSGMPVCQAAGGGGGGAGALGEGPLADPEDGSVQLSGSLDATLSLPPRASRRAAIKAS